MIIRLHKYNRLTDLSLSQPLLLGLLLLIASCNTGDSTKKTSDIETLIVNESGAVFYNPPDGYNDSLMKVAGDSYFQLRDSLTRSNDRLKRLFDSLQIPYQYTRADQIKFLEINGKTTLVEVKELASPWGVLYFEKGMTTLTLSPDFQSSLRLLRTVIPGFVLAPEKPVEIEVTNKIKQRLTSTPPVETEENIKMREYLHFGRLRTITGYLTEPGKTDSTIPDFSESSLPVVLNKIWQHPILLIKFDNDIFANTDIYYTNGVAIEHLAPLWQYSPLSRCLISPSKHGETYYGFSVIQNMYTPQYPVREDIQYGDRPFASYLLAGNFSIFNNATSRFRLTTELFLGVIGPASGGGSIQSYLHGEEKRPKGWKNQIVNDFLLNYNMSLEKGFYNSNNHNIMLITDLMAGSLYTRGAVGLKYHWGSNSSYFKHFYNLPLHFSPKQPWYTYFAYDFHLLSRVNANGYDATLQGGLINKESPYTLQFNEIHHLTWSAEAGLSLSYKRYTASFIQNIASPEFKNARWHKWGRIKLTIPL